VNSITNRRQDLSVVYIDATMLHTHHPSQTTS
jgi:hypothetical protein